MMMGKYILDGHKVVLCENLMIWAKKLESLNRHVAKTVKGDVEVNTIFLGLDHRFGSGPPLLFETMVFGGKNDQDMDRYSTWEEAEEGHKKMCKIVFGDEFTP